MNENKDMDYYSNLSHEIRSWKSSLKHLANELMFIERQLEQTDSPAVSMTLAMKKRTNSLKKLLQNLKLEVISYEHLSESGLKNSSIAPKDLIEEEQMDLRKKLEEFQKSFKFHKTRVLRFTGR